MLSVVQKGTQEKLNAKHQFCSTESEIEIKYIKEKIVELKTEFNTLKTERVDKLWDNHHYKKGFFKACIYFIPFIISTIIAAAQIIIPFLKK